MDVKYEAPKLRLAGRAGEVILGIASLGDDIDGYIFPREFEFESDVESETLLDRIS